MTRDSRTYNTIINSIAGILCSFVSIILNFFIRIVIVKELGEEIYGLHSLFQNITQVMLLMEMGINSAVIIHLYKPLALGVKEEIVEILYFYRKVYRRLAFFFFILSIIVSLFLVDEIVTTTISMSLVKIYFILFALSFPVNFLSYYKRSVLFAEQKIRISSLYTALCEFIFRVLQIGVLLCWARYDLFVILFSFEKLLGNYLCSKYVNKEHPYLRDLKEKTIQEIKKKAIFDTVRPLMINQIASTVHYSAAGILISILLGSVSIVGHYGNYQLIMLVVQTIYSQIGASFTSSFGNLSVSNDKQLMGSVYFKSTFVMNWLASFFCSWFIVCSSDFISIVFGGNFILNNESVIILAINLGLYLFSIPVISIQNALGLHKYDYFAMIIQAVFAIILGYTFGKIMGIEGILIGIIIPYFIVTFLNKGLVICNKALNIHKSKFLCFMSIEIFKISIVLITCFYVCSYITSSLPLMQLIIKFFVTGILCFVIPLVFSYRTKEFQYYKSLVYAKLKRK